MDGHSLLVPPTMGRPLLWSCYLRRVPMGMQQTRCASFFCLRDAALFGEVPRSFAVFANAKFSAWLSVTLGAFLAWIAACPTTTKPTVWAMHYKFVDLAP